MTGDTTRPREALNPYDGVLLVSFGGPEAEQDVMPFLRRVTGGRGVPDERLQEVARHYLDRGGVSPLPAECRALVAALRGELERRGHGLPVAWANRFAAPFLPEVLDQAAQAGHRRLVAVLTSAYPSYSGCRAYRDEIAAAVAALAAPTGHGAALEVDVVRPYAIHPGFSATNSRLTTEATRELLDRTGLPAGDIRLVFVTHSLPVAMDASSGPEGVGGAPGEGGLYQAWHRRLARAITDEVSATLGVRLRSDLAYCSRSGPPGQPWLEPDVTDHLECLAVDGVRGVVLAPIGFTSDHMEVVHDLDDEALGAARRSGLAAIRVPTVRDDPEFVSGLVDLMSERAAEARGEEPRRPCWPRMSPLPSRCAPTCCPPPARSALTGPARGRPGGGRP